MEKTYTATQKYLVMSPRKIRLVTELIKKMKPAMAIEKLPFVQKRAAEFVSKVIKNAIASATSQGVSETDLIFKEIQVGEGPRLKRGMAASRGRWHPILKRMSHIRVVLTTRGKSEARNKKHEHLKDVETKSKIKNTKLETKNVKKQKGKEVKA
ncbi:MAG TPA: 50S ribosomal protein L22 [Patescibacteria group bacterium]|nr:50S ribosomal protein L22 [Patescibacteria group bacterium]